MLPILILLAATATAPEAPHAPIEATIRGTNQPFEVELLLRTRSDDWEEIDHKRLPAGTRKVRFEGLASGVYQILLRGPSATERLGTKIGLGANDTRRTTADEARTRDLRRDRPEVYWSDVRVEMAVRHVMHDLLHRPPASRHGVELPAVLKAWLVGLTG
jgi:hypothetical protein